MKKTVPNMAVSSTRVVIVRQRGSLTFSQFAINLGMANSKSASLALNGFRLRSLVIWASKKLSPEYLVSVAAGKMLGVLASLDSPGSLPVILFLLNCDFIFGFTVEQLTYLNYNTLPLLNQ
jgi:hypothetical protein